MVSPSILSIDRATTVGRPHALLGPRNRFIDFKSTIVVNVGAFFLCTVSRFVFFYVNFFPQNLSVLNPCFFDRRHFVPSCVRYHSVLYPLGGGVGDIKKCEKLHFFAFSDTLSQNQCPQNLSASKPCFSGCMYVLPCCVRFIASCILQEGRGRRDKMRKIRKFYLTF